MVPSKKRYAAAAIAAVIAATTINPGMPSIVLAAESQSTVQVTSPVMESRVSDGLDYIPLSVDEESVTLIWGKPTNYSNYTDYAVYQDGVKIALSSENHLSPAQKAFDVFYNDMDNYDAVKITTHNYIASGLDPDTNYNFEVKGVTSSGTEENLMGDYTVQVTTKAAPYTVEVTTDGYNGIAGIESSENGGAKVYTEAIQSAIDHVANQGGGVVHIPQGTELISGSIHMKSNVTLKVDGVLRASLDLADCTPDNNKFLLNNAEKFSTFIIVEGEKNNYLQNVRIVGTGVIDGQGWEYRDSAPNVEYSDELGLKESELSNTTTISSNGILAKKQYDACINAGGNKDDAYKKRSNIIEGQYINHMYIGGGLTVQNPSNTVIGMKYITDYVVNGITTDSFNINNGDCINVARFVGFTALNNVVNSGDDNIVMNAGNASEDVVGSAWIFNNYMGRGHGAVAFGSGTTSWIDNVMAEDNVFVGTSDGLRCKSKPGSGGGARFVTFRDTAMRNLTNQVDGTIDGNVIGYQMDGCPFIFTTNYPGTYGTVKWPVFHDFDIYNCSVNGADTHGIIVDGTHDTNELNTAGISFLPVNNIKFTDVTFRNTKIPHVNQLKNSSFDNVVFHNSDGSLIADPWKNMNNIEEVYADGKLLQDTSRGINDDFEDYDEGYAVPEWNVILGDETNNSALVAVEDSGNHYLEFKHTGAAANITAARNFNEMNGSVDISFDYRLSEFSSDTKDFAIDIVDTNGERVVHFINKDSGLNLEYGEGKTKVPVTGNIADTWYTINISINVDRKTFTIGDTEYTFNSSKAENVSAFKITDLSKNNKTNGKIVKLGIDNLIATNMNVSKITISAGDAQLPDGTAAIYAEGQSITFTAEVEPDDVPNKNVTWSVEDVNGLPTEIAEIDPETGELMPLGNGTCYVVATSVQSPSVSQKMLLNISGQPEEEDISLVKILLDNFEDVDAGVGVEPDGWSHTKKSDNGEVAVISESNNQYLQMSTDNANDKDILTRVFDPQVGNIIVKWQFKLSDPTSNNKDTTFKLYSSNNKLAASFIVKDGTLKYEYVNENGGTSNYWIVGTDKNILTTNGWCSVEVVLDTQTKAYSVTVDTGSKHGTLVTDFYSPEAEDIAKFEITSPKPGKPINVGVDNFGVYIKREITAITSVSIVEGAEAVINGVDETLQLTTEINPVDAEYEKIVWNCNNPSVAKVSDEGLVTGLAAGKAVVTVEVTDLLGNVVDAQIDIIVIDTSLENEIILSDSLLNLTVGDVYTITVIQSDTDVEWSISNDKVITVYDPLEAVTESQTTSSGALTIASPSYAATASALTIKAVAQGNSVVKASSITDPDIYSECIVTVKDVEVNLVTVDFNSNGGSKVESQTVSEGSLIDVPNQPTRLNYSFGGWYKDKELTQQWIFDSDIVTENITLYAKWIKNSGSGESDNNSGGGGSNEKTESSVKSSNQTGLPSPEKTASENQKAIENLLKNNKPIEITLTNKSNSVNLNTATIYALETANEPLVVKQGQTAVIINPQTMAELKKSNGKDNVVISAKPLKNIDTDIDLAADVMDIIIKINGKEINSFDTPIQVAFDTSSYKLTKEDTEKLSGVRINENGTINKLGGSYNASTKTFTFYTSKLSKYSLMLTDDIVSLSLGLNTNVYQQNGQSHQFDTPPVISNDRVLVPVRLIAESFGADVGWNEASQQVSITLEGKILNLIIGRVLPGQEVSATIIDGRTMVPLRYIAEQFDANVVFDPAEKTIDIFR